MAFADWVALGYARQDGFRVLCAAAALLFVRLYSAPIQRCHTARFLMVDVRCAARHARILPGVPHPNPHTPFQRMFARAAGA